MSFYEERLEPMLRKTARVIEETEAMQSLFNGTMTDEQFRFYNLQDYQYLLDYLRAWATALGKTTDFQEISDILVIINDIYTGLEYCRTFWAKEAGVTPEEMDATIECEGKRSYTAYLNMVAHTSDIAGLVCAVFPCGIMYTYFAEDLLPRCTLDKENKYYKWLEYYTTEHYKTEARNKKALINSYCAGRSEKEIRRLLEIVATSCNYEILQWRDSYRLMETWPLEDIFPEK